MFSRARNFLYRHRRKFLFGSVFIGTLVLLTRYARSKLREWQDKEINELLERSKRRQYFESTERTCNQTVLLISSNLRASTVKCLDSEKIINSLRDGCKDKIALWNIVKVLAISRTATVIYSYTMLVVTLRIQVNILGGYMFKDSKVTPNSVQTRKKADDETKEKYLSLCNFLMNEGVLRLSTLIRRKVEEITSSYNLTDQLKLRDLQRIYWAVMSTISADEACDPVKNMSNYILSPEFRRDAQVDEPFSTMLDQTLDLLESHETQDLLKTNLRAGFTLLIDRLSEYFDEVPNKEGENGKMEGFMNLNVVTMPMAKIIPILNGQVPEITTDGDLPSDWIQRLLANEELKALGANIYEAFSF